MIRKTRLALLAAVGFIFVTAVFLWQAGFLSRRAPIGKNHHWGQCPSNEWSAVYR